MSQHTPSEQLLSGCLASVFEVALGALSDANIGEHAFRIGWHEALEQGRDHALGVAGSTRLRVALGYPVFQRGVTEEQIKLLESKTRYTPAPSIHSMHFKFALLSSYLIEGAESKVILGRCVRPRGVHIPILAELESAPSKTTPMDDDNNAEFQHLLQSRLAKARHDFCRKLPIIFACHSQQRTIITLACADLWWKFSIIGRDEKTLVWSKTFSCGSRPDDDVLLALIEAAANCPDDPKSSPRIQKILDEHIQPDGEVGTLEHPAT